MSTLTMPTVNVIQVTKAELLSDDRNYAIMHGNAEPGSFLLSLPQYAGTEPTECEFEIPVIGTVRVPGLNNPLFASRSVMAFDDQYHDLGYQLIRLPAIYVMLCRALQCAQELPNGYEPNDPTAMPGSHISAEQWQSRGRQIRYELLTLSSRMVSQHMLRSREGLGFMALAQANPNLSENQVGIGLGLARELLRDTQDVEMTYLGFDPHDPTSRKAFDASLQRSELGRLVYEDDAIVSRFRTVSDLAGLQLSSLVRFPATTSKSVRTDMHIVLSGLGRCVYLNPSVLKKQMEGDVDGDQIFGEVDPTLRCRNVAQKVVQVADTIRPELYSSDYRLGDIQPVNSVDEFQVYLGMDGKNGIGEATNFAYRGMLIQDIQYGQSSQTRDQYWNYIERPDFQALMPHGIDEQEIRKIFRHLTSRILMDGVHPIYEGTFDLRKDDSIRHYLETFFRGLRGQEPMDFEKLARMQFRGRPIDIKPLQIVWGAAEVNGKIGRMTQFIQQYPILDIFFTGKGDSHRKNLAMKRIIEEIPEYMSPSKQQQGLAQYLVDELNGLQYTNTAQGSRFYDDYY